MPSVREDDALDGGRHICPLSEPCKWFPCGPALHQEGNLSIRMKIRQASRPLCLNNFHIQYDEFSQHRPVTTGTGLAVLRRNSRYSDLSASWRSQAHNAHPREKVREVEVGKTFHPSVSKAPTPGGGCGEAIGRAAPTTEASPDLSLCGFVLFCTFKQASQPNVSWKTSPWKLLGRKLSSPGSGHPALSLLGSPSALLPLGENGAKGTPRCLPCAITVSSLTGCWN